jgi:uncharacterized protein (DUF58 family)
MDWGEGEQNKFHYALNLAAALGTIALASGDQVTIAGFQAGNPSTLFGPVRGQQNTMRMLKFLESLAPGGRTDLQRSLRDYALEARRPGLAFLISDLFSSSDYQAGFTQVRSRGYQVNLIHVLSPDELDPPLAGDLRLLDVETGQAQEVSLDGGMRDLYRERLKSWRAEIQAACRKRGIHFLGLSTAQAWDQVVLQEMRRAGVVK